MLTVLSLLMACGQEAAPPPPPPPPPPKPEVQDSAAPPPAVNRPPRITSIRFEPAAPTTQTDLSVTVQADDPDSPEFDVDYQWSVNGKLLLHRTAEVLPASDFKKGDEILMTATASDGETTVQRDSEVLVIANSPPFFLSDPRSITQVDGFTVKAKDPDDDPITYRIEGAPRGMSVDPKRGTLHYTGSTDEPGGDYSITVIAEDPDGANVRWEFGLTVTPGSDTKKKTGSG